MKTMTLGLILLVFTSLGLFAQQDNKLQFANELKGKEAYIPFSQKVVKGNDNKLNILFKNDSIYWPTIHVAVDVLQKDSFYYVLGSYPDNSFLTKFDLQGNKSLQKTNIWNDEAHSMYYFTSNKLTQLSDGNMAYLYAELHIDTIHFHNRYVPVVKYFDDSLNVKSTYYWNDTISFYPGGGIVADKDKGFTYCGQLASRSMTWIQYDSTQGYYLEDSTYLGIVIVDSNLNAIYNNKTYVQHPDCSSENMRVEDLEKAHDGGYIVGGHVNACAGVNGWAGYSAYIVKFDSLLNHQWTKVFEDSIYKDEPINIVPSKYGKSYIYTRGHTKTQSIAYGKFDENGTILWEKYFRKTLDTNGMAGVLTIWDRPHGVIEKDNGDIIFGSRINGNRATGLVRTDSVGNVKWSRVISTNYGDSLLYYSYIFNLKNPIGEGALLVGRVHTMGAFLIRTDSLGCTLPNCLDTTLHVSLEEIIELKEQKLIVYPNPTQHTIQVAINEQGERLEQIIIYDINGREIINETMDTYIFTKDISSFSKGVYIIKVKGSNGSILSKKFVKH